MNIPKDVIEAVDKNSNKEETKMIKEVVENKEVVKEVKNDNYKPYYNNNRNYRDNNNDPMTLDKVINYLDFLSIDQLTVMKDYIDATIKRKEIRNKF